MTAAVPQPQVEPASVFSRFPWRWVVPLLALSVLAAASGAVAYRYLRDSVRDETARTLTVLAEQKRQQIEGWLAQASGDADLYFSGTSQLKMLLEQWLAGGRRDPALLRRMEARLSDLARVRGWSGFAVTDAQGGPVVAGGDSAVAMHEARIRELLRHPQGTVTDLHTDPEGHAHYCVLAPIASEGSSPLGVVLLTWRADLTLFPLVASWPVPTLTAETYLVERDGEAVRFLTPLRFPPAKDLGSIWPLSSPELPAARGLLGQHGLLRGGRDYRGAPVLAYVTPVAGSRWLMVAEMDEAEADAGIRSSAWAVGAIVALGLVVLYIGGLLLWSRARHRRELADLQAREAADARFRLLFEQHLAVMLLIDPADGRILDANPAAADFYGYPRDRLRAMAITEINCLPAETVAAEWHRAEQRAQSAFVFPHRLADGSVRTVEVHSAPIVLDDRQVLFSIVQDITERRRIEEQLRLSEERHRLVADGSLDVIWTMDLQGHLTYVSPSVERLRGYTPAEVMGQTLEEILAPESYAIVRSVLEAAVASLRAGTPVQPFRGEVTERRKDGSLVCVETTATVIYDPQGRFVEVLGVSRDIGERKRYEEELRQALAAAEQASRAKSEFLALVSHEIRTPMNAVLGLAQVLARQPLTADQRDMVARIHSAGQSLQDILDDVLDLSKIEAGELRVEPRPFRLTDLTSKLDRLMGPAARARGLRLDMPAPPPPLRRPLLADPLRLEQVLVNLVGNAIKFTEQGRVSVAIEPVAIADAEPRLRFTVRDTGIGIAPEALGRLFTPFTQADSGIARRFGGTGLGLSICKRLVELMGGAIGAESQVGEGSAFWFELPLTWAPPGETEDPSAASEPHPQGPRLVGARVLVVDDSAMNRDLAERALALEGATAVQAVDGQQAVDLLRERPEDFDAVLMDIRMPGMDGLAATRLIRGELGLGAVPVIALTAGVLPEERAAALAAGVDEVLAKPLDLERMTVALERRIRPHPAARPSPGTTQDPSEPLPEIPGIDRSRVSQVLIRDPGLFLRLLARLAEDHGEVVPQTRRDLVAGDREGATRRLHTLRGDAANLGATALAERAWELEQSVAGGMPITDLEARLAGLDRQLAALVEASAPWCGASPAPPGDPSSATGSAPPDPIRLQALREALHGNNAKAWRLFEELERPLQATLGEDAGRALGAAVRDLRFADALAILDRALEDR